MNLRRAALTASLVLGSFVGASGAGVAAAQSQGFAIDRFTMAPSVEDGMALQLPDTLGHGRMSARLLLGYQRESLLSGSPSGSDVAIIRDQVTAQAAFALGLGERFEVFALLPVTVYQSGETASGSGLAFQEPSAAGSGDLAVGGSVHLLGQRERGLSLGLNAAVLLPLGSTDALASDGELGARGTLSAALVLKPVTFAIEGGIAYRPERRIGFTDSGSEALLRAGAYVPVAQRLRLMAELNGATRLSGGNTFDDLATPLEALLGGDYALRSGLRFGVGGGPGLTLATGTPLMRVFATIGYAAPRQEGAQEPSADRDRDGFADANDACPDQPEDQPDYAYADGCPQASDGDAGGAPEQSTEQITKDSDGDGVEDRLDKCPNEREDLDGVDDHDGCPDAEPVAIVVDGDGDGLPDDRDECPTQPESPNGFEDQDGCPDEVPAPTPEIVLPEPTRFGFKSAALDAGSRKQLEQALQTLREHPELQLSIEGHSSGDGDAAFNQKLSEQRAQAVKNWLVARGVKPERLQVRGFGASQPRVSGDDDAALAQNRRVELIAR